MSGTDRKQKILIVDDVPVNLKILRAILQNDYEVSLTTGSMFALELAQSNRPDLILLDVMMPDMDGYEMCEYLKSDPQTCDIPVIFITARSGEEDEARGFALGAVDYISKPFRPAIVYARVKTHLSIQAMQRRLARQNAALLEADQLKRRWTGSPVMT